MGSLNGMGEENQYFLYNPSGKIACLEEGVRRICSRPWMDVGLLGDGGMAGMCTHKLLSPFC